jgi:hypothetical protein
MKKPTPYIKIRQNRLARYRFMERYKRKNKHKVRPENRYVIPGALIKAPNSFNVILGAGKHVVKFLRAVSRRVLIEKLPTRLDFKDTEHFLVPGTILLFSELNRIVSLAEIPKPVTIIDPHSRRAREVLKQIGVHNLTGDSCDIVPEREDVVYWKATKGKTQSGDTYGSLVESIAERANKDHTKQIEVSGLWRSVNEAVANSIDHAYKKPRADGFSGLDETKWWMFSQIKDGIFTLAVCDLGCGYRQTIGETIPEKFVATCAAAFVGKNRDALAIDTAMQYGRSGTNAGNRGKGSRDVLSLLEKHGDGEVVVLSNTGWMKYGYKNKKECNREHGGLGIDIGGTIIWWKLDLNGTELNNDHNQRG